MRSCLCDLASLDYGAQMFETSSFSHKRYTVPQFLLKAAFMLSQGIPCICNQFL